MQFKRKESKVNMLFIGNRAELGERKYSHRQFNLALLVMVLLLGGSCLDVLAQQKEPNTAFSKSPEEISNSLKLRHSVVEEKSLLPFAPLQPVKDAWTSFNDVLVKKFNLDLGIDYTTLYQNMSTSLPGTDSDGFGGDIDVTGKWTLLQSGKKWEGSVAFWAEGRHHIHTDLSPGDLFPNVGSVMGPTDTFDSNQHFTMREIYWQQGSKDAHFMYRLGRFAPDALVGTISQFDSASLDFMPFGLVTRGSARFPDPGWAAAVGYYPQGDNKLSPHFVAMISDQNGNRETFGDIGAGEYFTGVEFGLRPFPMTDHAPHWRFSAWHADAQEANGNPEGYGILAKIEQELTSDGRIIGVLNWGRSWNNGAVWDQSATVRLVINEPTFGPLEGVFFKGPASLVGDRFGIGFGWVDPSFAGARGEYSIDTYYRFPLTPNLDMTLAAQYMMDPALIPLVNAAAPATSTENDLDDVFVFSVRFRVAF